LSAFKYFTFIITAQLFYAFGITLIAYSLPPDAVNYVSLFQPSINVSLENTTVQIQESVQQQMNIPLIDLGALVFYSGNIIVDLMLNFFFAVPEMFSILLGALFIMLNVDAYLATQLKLFATAIISILYMIGVLQFLMSIRARGTII